MSGPSPFAEDWRDCLRAHYQQVVRHQDHTTERTLVGVLQRLGFSDAELGELKVLATLRAEDMDPDFVPDLDILTAEAVEAIQQQSAGVSEAPELPAGFEAVSVGDASEDAPPENEETEEPPDYRGDGPQQMSFF
jgi:hypothetical protein